MGKIIILDENTANKIAAGEVIERPASVVKELVENSIDAGATSIQVEIRNGGISFIKVIDNGSGIAEDDAEIAFERHSTSKIRRADDLESISSMGFRGEALASIGAVSSIQLSTRQADSVHGTSVHFKGGSLNEIKPTGCPVGTTFIIRDLFFNTPARYKFLKKDTTEAGYVADALGRIALGYPDISFKLVSGGAPILHTPGNGDLKSAIFSIYGAETAKAMIEVTYDDGRIQVFGYVGKAELSRSNRAQQSIYINRRYVRSKTVTAALDAAYTTFMMKNRYAFALLDIRLNPSMVDVNVHPTKMEVKFSSEQEVYRAVYHAVNSSLINQSTVRTLPGTSDAGTGTSKSVGSSLLSGTGQSEGQRTKDYYHLDRKPAEKAGYTQESFEWVRTELDRKRAEAISGTGIDHNEGSRLAVADPVITAGYEAPAITGEPEMEPRFHDIFEGARIIGQAFTTYILLERGDELFLLDQHAAHERIRYEELLERYSKNEPLAQSLLSVMSIELTGKEYLYAMNEAAFMEKLGFTYDSFGTNAVILRTVPVSSGDADIRSLFMETLDGLMQEGKPDPSAADETLFKMACKTAVKANRKLEDREIEALLRRLSALENPLTCPHGRPAILKLKRYDMEKLFKRIV